MDSDEVLYYSYLDGKDEALQELLNRYRNGLTLFIFGIVGNMEDSEDLMMEAFAVLLAKEKTFAGHSSFKTWLFSIGRNKAISFLRKKKPLFYILERVEKERHVYNKTPEIEAFDKMHSSLLYEAMLRLKTEYRDVLYLKLPLIIDGKI